MELTCFGKHGSNALMSFLPKLFVFLVSLGGSGLILFMSKWGIGTFVDTFHYLYGAKSFSDGIGMMDLPQGADRPFVHFPPLLPIALSALHSLGFDWLRGALYLNAALFGLSAFSCGFILKKMTGNWWYGLLGAVFFLVNPSMVYVHSFLLSEPLFLFLSIWCIFFLEPFYLSNSHNPMSTKLKIAERNKTLKAKLH